MEGKKNNTFTIAFAGDTSLGDCYIYKMKNEELISRLHNESLSFFSKVEPLVKDSDHLIINLETVLADNPAGGIENKKYLNWDNPERTINTLSKLGVTAVSLANNHSMDYGPGILNSTIAYLDSAGIKVIGAGNNQKEAGRPYAIELRGAASNKKIYILACMFASRRYYNYGFFASHDSPGVNGLELNNTIAEIKELKRQDPSSLVILFPHWQGYDYKSLPGDIKDISRKLIASGADYVIGHGTHAAGCMEKSNNGTIIHTIGNFVFNSPGRYRKMKALPYSYIIRLEFEEINGNWTTREKVYPIFSDNRHSNFKPRLTNDYESKKLREYIVDKSRSIPSPEPALKFDHFGYYFTFQNDKNRHQKPGRTENSKEINYQRIIQNNRPDKAINHYEERSFSTKALLAKEFEQAGYHTDQIDKYLVAHLGREQVFFFETETSLTSLLGWRILKNKLATRLLLEKAGITIAQGAFFSKTQKPEAREYVNSIKNCVLKPSDGRKGKGITVGVYSDSDFEQAWNGALKHSKHGILIEEQFMNGIDARYCVINGNCVAVYRRILPVVCGNNKDNVERLIEKKNLEKANNLHLKNKLIHIDNHRLSIIKNQGFRLEDIPPTGTEILIDWKASISTGADTYDYTDEVHPLFKRIAEKTAKIFPGLDIVGIDILAHDHTSEPAQDNYIVIEANTRPGIGGHHYPVYGKPRNVAKEIVNYVIELMQDKGASR